MIGAGPAPRAIPKPIGAGMQSNECERLSCGSHLFECFPASRELEGGSRIQQGNIQLR